ncbi:MAG: hypothetical protein P8J87_20670, partial [Verrucomicrobiales bacterium]|nr:hypothetical protein [Verrucomicrobiales bacterium]
MGSDLKNPYLRDSEPEEIRMGRGMAWFLIALFLGVLVVPPLVRNVVDSSGGGATVFERLAVKASGVGLVEHLRAVETHVEGAFFTEAPRRGIQNLFTAALGEGNRKTVIGQDGWLYLRPSVEALTSTGPLAAAPVGAASDPALKRWLGPREAIRKFADELGERGIELVLLPVPVKAMVRPEGLGVERPEGVVRHSDAAAFYREFEEMGISVLDLGGVLWELRGGDGVFMKQDTHWTAGAMEVAAGRVAEFLRSRPWWEDLGERHGFEVVEVGAQGIGDLVEHLELGDGGGGFECERVTLRRVIDVETG